MTVRNDARDNAQSYATSDNLPVFFLSFTHFFCHCLQPFEVQIASERMNAHARSRMIATYIIIHYDLRA